MNLTSAGYRSYPLSSPSSSATITSSSTLISPLSSPPVPEINYHANKSYSKAYSAYSSDQLALISNPPPRSYAAAVSPFIQDLMLTPDELRSAGRSLTQRTLAKTVSTSPKNVIPWDPATSPQSSSFYYTPDCDPFDISHSGFQVSKHEDNFIYIDQVTEGSVGEAAGFQSGDQILFAHNREIKCVSDFVLVLQKIPGSLNIRVKRDGEEVTLLLARSSRKNRY
jgi:hypothetical protein